MYRETPVPIDGNKAAERAIDHAPDLAETYDARIHTLYVVDTSIYTSLDAGAGVVIDAPEREDDAVTRHVRGAAEEAGIDVQTEVATKTTYRSIREYIDDHDIDLTVMGTHGCTGLNHYLLGSVTRRVVYTSPAPVLTVRLGDDEENEADAVGEVTDTDANAEG